MDPDSYDSCQLMLFDGEAGGSRAASPGSRDRTPVYPGASPDASPTASPSSGGSVAAPHRRSPILTKGDMGLTPSPP